MEAGGGCGYRPGMSPSVSTLHEFIAAIDAFPGGHALAVDWSPGARRAAQRSLDRHGLCLLGEVHGVAENPLIVERLVGELGIAVVALEWPRGLERAVDDPGWLGVAPPTLDRRLDAATERQLAAGIAWCGDGRVTAGHFAVLRRIPACVVAVDEPLGPATAGERDAAMAGAVERLLGSAGQRVLFVAGNGHTCLREHGHYRPAGMHLARARPALCTVDVHYGGGRFWNCGSRACPSVPPPPGPYLHLAEAREAVVLDAAAALPPGGQAPLGPRAPGRRPSSV